MNHTAIITCLMRRKRAFFFKDRHLNPFVLLQYFHRGGQANNPATYYCNIMLHIVCESRFIIK